MYQNKVQRERVHHVVNINKTKFEELYGLVDLNIDTYSKIENDKTPEAKFLKANDSEDTETNKTSAIFNFMSKILPDDKMAKSKN